MDETKFFHARKLGHKLDALMQLENKLRNDKSIEAIVDSRSLVADALSPGDWESAVALMRQSLLDRISDERRKTSEAVAQL